MLQVYACACVRVAHTHTHTQEFLGFKYVAWRDNDRVWRVKGARNLALPARPLPASRAPAYRTRTHTHAHARTRTRADDACPHRLAPLSEGRVDRDTNTLECAYHGWAFEPQGTCKRIPQLRPDVEVYTHTHTHTYMHTYIHAYIHACMHTYIHAYIYT